MQIMCYAVLLQPERNNLLPATAVCPKFSWIWESLVLMDEYHGEIFGLQ